MGNLKSSVAVVMSKELKKNQTNNLSHMNAWKMQKPAHKMEVYSQQHKTGINRKCFLDGLD